MRRWRGGCGLAGQLDVISGGCRLRAQRDGNGNQEEETERRVQIHKSQKAKVAGSWQHRPPRGSRRIDRPVFGPFSDQNRDRKQINLDGIDCVEKSCALPSSRASASHSGLVNLQFRRGALTFVSCLISESISGFSFSCQLF